MFKPKQICIRKKLRKANTVVIYITNNNGQNLKHT